MPRTRRASPAQHTKTSFVAHVRSTSAQILSVGRIARAILKAMDQQSRSAWSDSDGDEGAFLQACSRASTPPRSGTQILQSLREKLHDTPDEKPAKTKRRRLEQEDASPASTQIAVLRTFAVSGPGLKQPVLIWPLRTIDAKSWAVINEDCAWLRVVCTHGKSARHSNVFQSALSQLRRDVKALLAAQRRADDKNKVAVELGKIKQQLGVEDDSDEDVGALSKAKSSVITLTLEGKSLQWRNQVRPLIVEANEASIGALVAYFKKHVAEGQVVLKEKPSDQSPPADAAKKFHLPADCCPNIPGKVSWHPSHSSWCAHIKNSSLPRERCQYYDGLRVDEKNSLGVTYLSILLHVKFSNIGSDGILDSPCVRPSIRALIRASVHALVRPFVRPPARPRTLSFGRVSVRSLARSLARSSVRACARSFVRSFTGLPIRPPARSLTLIWAQMYGEARLACAWYKILWASLV